MVINAVYWVVTGGLNRRTWLVSLRTKRWITANTAVNPMQDAQLDALLSQRHCYAIRREQENAEQDVHLGRVAR